MNRALRFCVGLVTSAAVAATVAAAASRPPAEVLRQDAARILARPEYRQTNSLWLQMWLIRIIRDFIQWWREHVGNRFAGLYENAPILYWSVVGLCVLILAAVIYHIYLTVRSAFGTGRRRRSALSADLHDRQRSEPQALLDQAEAAARAGAFTEALRYLYLALIQHLDRRDVLRYDVARTNQEYLRQARKFPAIVEPLRAVTRLADQAWYGHYRLGAVEYERCRELVQAAWQEAEHVAPV